MQDQDNDNNPKKRTLEKDDKVALAVVSVVLSILTLSILFLMRYLKDSWVSFFSFGSSGVGWQSSFVFSVGISLFFIILLSIFAGDGVVGELGVMLVGFFVMLLFFTVSIALIL